MSVYVGIDVAPQALPGGGGHRGRDGAAEQEHGERVEPVLRLIGDLPSGTPVAFEAAFGWGWLVQLLEDYGFDPHLVHPLRCKAIASARLKNDLLTELPGVPAGHRLD
jgi:transposase